MNLFQQISNDNRIKYGTEAERVLKIIINQYSDRTHFIYEILQNAEDAGATHIKFRLEKDKLLVFHNGRLFNEKDINGVCGIADGTKQDGTRIGHFGIGFKSVYCYTEVPLIYSGEYHFRILNQLFPEEIAKREGLAKEETCMVLPFNKPDVSKDIAYAEIKNALIKKITADSILMLNNIEDVEIEIDGYFEVININKQKYPLDKQNYPKNVFALSLNTTVTNIVTKKGNQKDADYLFFTDAEKEATAIIFKVEEKELQEIKNSKVYAFFPTAKEAHQNFYIHAPFDTTPARDNFKEGAEYGKHNLQLVNNICKLIWFAFTWMRDHGYLSVQGFKRVFPIYEYEEDDVLYGIYQNSIDIVREEEILPTNIKGEFKVLADICIPLWGVIVDIFNDEDLRRLRGKRTISWLAKEFSTNSYTEILAFLNNNFDITTLDWKDLVLKLDAFFLQQKPLSWTEKLMDKIESYCIKKPTYDSHYIDVTNIPFVRTSRGEQICARDESGHLLVYLNNPDVAKYKIDADFKKNDSIRSFYSRALRIPEYNIVQEAIENILPKYESRPVKFKTSNTIRENIEDLKIIKDAIYTNLSVLDKLADKYIVTDGTEWYRPSDIYIRSNDIRCGYSLVKDYVNFVYLSNKYFDDTVLSIKLDEDFFKKIGCNLGLKVIETLPGDYLKKVKKYQGQQAEMTLRNDIFAKSYVSKKLNWGFDYEGFSEVFQNMTKEKSFAIAKFLNPNAMNFDIKGELVAANDQHFCGASVSSVMAYSMLGLTLCFEKWIYVQNDDKPHSPLEVDKDDLLFEYKQAKRLISVLPFKEVKNALIDWLEANIENQADVELIKHYLSSPEELTKVAKAMAKNEAAQDARKGKARSARDLIENGDKEQKIQKPVETDLDINPISEKAKEKREENLDKELAASLDFDTSVTKGFTFASRKSNKEEKQFLLQEYDGHCQICLKQITKHDGDRYFEAINVIKFAGMEEKFENSSRLGWNSLSLCPNCAAEYNYASKRISSLYEQVMATDIEVDSDDAIEIGIELPMGEAKTIKYSPRHLLALKEALKIYDKE